MHAMARNAKKTAKDDGSTLLTQRGRGHGGELFPITVTWDACSLGTTQQTAACISRIYAHQIAHAIWQVHRVFALTTRCVQTLRCLAPANLRQVCAGNVQLLGLVTHLECVLSRPPQRQVVHTSCCATWWQPSRSESMQWLIETPPGPPNPSAHSAARCYTAFNGRMCCLLLLSGRSERADLG
jgi:hypothetical protein